MRKYKIKNLKNIHITDIDVCEYPKFESAHIDYAENNSGKVLTDEELEWINYASENDEDLHKIVCEAFNNSD